MDEKLLLNDNLKIVDDELYFANKNVNKLADKYKTPLYIMDEEGIIKRCRDFIEAINTSFNKKAKVLYASKALSFIYMYKIMKKEKMGIDVVSLGEIYTAKAAGYDLSKAYFHSNNKTEEDIKEAIGFGVGYFVVDNTTELDNIEKIAKKNKIVKKVLIRVTPGIDPHTYEKVATGKVDSKFGCAIETGDAESLVSRALKYKNIKLMGFHCHVGSQVFDAKVFNDSAKIMMDFIKDMKDKFDYKTLELNLGGGFGVRYTKEDKKLDIKKIINDISICINKKCKDLKIDMPVIIFEPGRSIVADNSITIYEVGNVKRIKGYKNYVSVDGGMGDNIRFALYGSKYTVIPTKKLSSFDKKNQDKYDVVGRFCESGDELQKNVLLPKDIKANDYIAFLTTGAYQYSMASNYNRVKRPAIIMIGKNKTFEVVRRERLDDLISLDIK